MADQLAELGRKVQLIGDLGTNAVEPTTGRVIPIERKTELLTDPQDMVTWLSYAKSVAMAENNGIYSTTVVGVIDQLATKFTEMTKGKGVLDIYELTTAFTLLAQSCQNIQSMALSGLNKMLKGANITKFDNLVGRSGKDGQPGRDGKRGQGPESKKRKQNDGHAGGRGSTGGDGGDPGNGGEKSSTTGCFVTVTSERPWVSDIYVIKDSFADHARKEKVIKPRENFGCAWSTAGAAARWGDWYFPIVGG